MAPRRTWSDWRMAFNSGCVTIATGNQGASMLPLVSDDVGERRRITEARTQTTTRTSQMTRRTQGCIPASGRFALSLRGAYATQPTRADPRAVTHPPKKNKAAPSPTTMTIRWRRFSGCFRTKASLPGLRAIKLGMDQSVIQRSRARGVRGRLTALLPRSSQLATGPWWGLGPVGPVIRPGSDGGSGYWIPTSCWSVCWAA